jgi:ferredoxin-NADP reductase
MTDLLTAPTCTRGAGVDAGIVEAGIDEELVCTAISQVTHDVRTFELRRSEPGRFAFLAGQHVTVAVVVDGRRLERCYTLSSPPTRPDRVSITVKRVLGGPVSTWLHDGFRVGDRLHAAGPLGGFTLEEHPARRHLFLSAGSGITPLMSMTRVVRDLGEPHDIAFVHSARTPADIVFRSELEAMTGGDLRVTTVCETDSGDPAWHGELGRLTLPMLTRIVPDLGEREVFICGPAGYLASVRSILAQAGVDPARCHEESFVLGAPARPSAGVPGLPGLADVSGVAGEPAAPVLAGVVGEPTAPVVTAAAPTAFGVELRRSGRTLVCDADTFVLEAAARAGIELPSSCGEGVCGTCKSTLLGGSVDMQHAGGIRPREIAQQRILLCCSKPLEDLVIDA